MTRRRRIIIIEWCPFVCCVVLSQASRYVFLVLLTNVDDDIGGRSLGLWNCN